VVVDVVVVVVVVVVVAGVGAAVCQRIYWHNTTLHLFSPHPAPPHPAPPLQPTPMSPTHPQLPTSEEVLAHLSSRKLSVLVFFLDETFEEVSYDVTTTVLEAVEQVAGIIRLQAYSTFTLFVGYKPVVASKAIVEGGPGDEQTLLDDNRWV